MWVSLNDLKPEQSSVWTLFSFSDSGVKYSFFLIRLPQSHLSRLLDLAPFYQSRRRFCATRSFSLSYHQPSPAIDIAGRALVPQPKPSWCIQGKDSIRYWRRSIWLRYHSSPHLQHDPCSDHRNQAHVKRHATVLIGRPANVWIDTDKMLFLLPSTLCSLLILSNNVIARPGNSEMLFVMNLEIMLTSLWNVLSRNGGISTHLLLQFCR